MYKGSINYELENEVICQKRYRSLFTVYFSSFLLFLSLSLSSQGKHAKCKQYVGHSSHVTNVRFSQGDCKLVSTGGADTAVMVWANQGAQGVSGLEEDAGTDSEAEEEGEDWERG